MSPGLAAVGLAVIIGAVVAVSAREARVAVLGLVLALVGAPLVVSTSPTVLALAARLVAAILAGYLLWIALRAGPGRTAGSRTGWPVESLVAAAAALIGWGAGGLEGDLLGARESVAVAFGLAGLAIAPAMLRRDPLQLAIGLALGVTAAGLLRAGLAGPPSAFEQVAIAGITVALVGGAALVTHAALATNESLELLVRQPDGAHRAEPRGATAAKAPVRRTRAGARARG